MDLLVHLREATDGWSGDAYCVSADVASAAADEIERLRNTLERCKFRLWGAGPSTDPFYADVLSVLS